MRLRLDQGGSANLIHWHASGSPMGRAFNFLEIEDRFSDQARFSIKETRKSTSIGDFSRRLRIFVIFPRVKHSESKNGGIESDREDLAKHPSPANPLRTRLEIFEFLASFSRQRLEVRVETQQVDWRVLANRLCHRGRRRIQCLP